MGPIAAALAWLALNLVYLTVTQSLMTRRILRGELLRWYVIDLAPVLAVSAAAVLAAGWLVPLPASRLGQAAVLAGIGLAVQAAALAVSPMRVEAVTWLHAKIARFLP